MDLRERLSGRESGAADLPADPFGEVKNRIHLSLIQDLGRQLFNADIDSPALRERVKNDVRARLSQEHGIARTDRERLVDDITDGSLGHRPLERLLSCYSI